LAIFWSTFAFTLVAVGWLSLIPRQQSFDTGGARQIWRLGPHAYEAQFPGQLPSGCAIGCAGLELAEAASADEVVHEVGRYWLDAPRGIVRWSTNAAAKTFDTAIPVAVVIVNRGSPATTGKVVALLWIAAVVLAATGLTLAMGEFKRRSTFVRGESQSLLARGSAAFTLNITAGLTPRIVVVLALGVGLAFSLIPHWNWLVTCPDSRSYVENWRIRTPLTAKWIRLFDSDPGHSRTGSVPSEIRTIAHWGASHRYVAAVRAWKVLFVVSVCVFAWWLMSVVPWWMAAPFLVAAVGLDASKGPWTTGMSGYLDVLLSEPLSYSLTILLVASLCAYFAKPSWTRGIAMVVCLNLLLFARPASVAFAAVLGCVWLFHFRRDGLLGSCRRAGGLAALFVVGIALHCTFNLVHYGHFRQHACGGMALMTTALEVADAEDAKVFSDPQLARYAEQTIAEAVMHRQVPFNAGAADANCWQFAVPAYAAVYGASAEQEPFSADDVLTRVARRIIRRHPGEFVRLAASSFWNGFWQPWIHVPLLATCAAGFWLFWRSGDWRFLFIACLAALPFVGIIPACATNYPIDRYRSLTNFAEIWSLPLLLGSVGTRRMNTRVNVINRECDNGSNRDGLLAA
jgi:hypothetical protein